MKIIFFLPLLMSVILLPSIASANQYDEINAEVAAVVRNIRENGPPELRQLSSSTIDDTVRTFVIGRRVGSIGPAELARMGGVTGAAQSSLMGQLKASGGR